MITISTLPVPVAGLSALDVISTYRPQWLRRLGRDSIQNSPGIKVYIDNSGSSGDTLSSLRQINALSVEAIEFFTPNEAQFRFGLDNSAGAILVHMK